jgi:hypothetical protein
MTLRPLQLVIALGLAGIFPAIAQSTHVEDDSLDAAWAKTYAKDCGSAMKHPCPPSTNGYENEFNGDRRLPELLRRSLPQRESWWVNGYAGSALVSSIVQQFIGVPGDLIVDEDRYVTASGCVPRDCGDGGMLWIDTAEQPATVVFIAHGAIEGFKDAGDHLWLYTSKPMNFEALPTDLLRSLDRWHKSIVSRYDPQHITLATLVQPNGRMHDLTYDMLSYKQNAPQFHPAGAKQ